MIEGADAPSMLVYVDTAKLFELVYPFVPLAVVFGHDDFGAAQATTAAGRDPFGPGDPPAPGAGHGGPPPHEAGAGVDQPAAVAGHRVALDGRSRLCESPQSLEQQIAAEGQPKAAMNRLGTHDGPRRREPSAEARPAQPASVLAPTARVVAVQSLRAARSARRPVQPPPPPGSVRLPGDGWPVPTPAAPLGQVTEGRLGAIGAGVKAYRDKHRTMPPAYLADKQGKPLLSWRVALLPYLGQQDLYKRFHLDEPWDGPHNRQLIPLIPEVYQVFDADGQRLRQGDRLRRTAAGKTRFLLLRGPKTVYADPAPPMPRTYEEWLKIIVVVASAERAVPWTKPEEFTYDAKNPRRRGLGGESGADDPMLKAGSVVSAFRDSARIARRGRADE